MHVDTCELAFQNSKMFQEGIFNTILKPILWVYDIDYIKYFMQNESTIQEGFGDSSYNKTNSRKSYANC